MRIILFAILFLAFFVNTGFGQKKGNDDGIDVFTKLQSKSGGSINVKQDSGLVSLVRRYVQFCEDSKGFAGYRIKIFFDSGRDAREKANVVKKKFAEEHKEYETYIEYNSPNWEVFAGDFRSKPEALKLWKNILPDYPSSFIVKALINYPAKPSISKKE